MRPALVQPTSQPPGFTRRKVLQDDGASDRVPQLHAPPCGRLSAKKSYHTVALHPPPLASASPGQGKILIRELHRNALLGRLVVEIAGLLCALERHLVVAHLQPALLPKTRETEETPRECWAAG